MTARLFTFVCEFRGTTYVSQVSATNERDVVGEWAKMLRTERPFGRASSSLANSVETGATDFPPVAIQGIANVWCITATCGGDLMLANIVETVSPTNR